MTTTDFSTTTRRVLLPPFAVARSHSDLAILQHDLSANVAQAQAAGDTAHAAAAYGEKTGAYHSAFVDSMREQGTPMPCACAYCATKGN